MGKSGKLSSSLALSLAKKALAQAMGNVTLESTPAPVRETKEVTGLAGKVRDKKKLAEIRQKEKANINNKIFAINEKSLISLS